MSSSDDAPRLPPSVRELEPALIRHLIGPGGRRADLFRRLVTPALRRQVVRWLIEDRPAQGQPGEGEAGEETVEILRLALGDPDWEVRASAVIAVARLELEELALPARDVELPRTGKEGLDRFDRDVLRGLPWAAQQILTGRPLPAEPPAETHPMDEQGGCDAGRARLLRAVAGCLPRWPERIFLLVHALATPVPTVKAPPRALAAYLTARDDLYVPAGSADDDALELVWVPPVPHWLGEHGPGELGSGGEPEPGLLPSPIRRATPSEDGFFVARYSLFGGGPCSLEEASQACERLADTTGLPLRLPTPDEWESAARGPDGRRFPWGNGLEKDGPAQPSPWGAEGVVGAAGEWAVEPGAGDAQARGGPLFHCARRRAVRPEERLAVRPILAAADLLDRAAGQPSSAQGS